MSLRFLVGAAGLTATLLLPAAATSATSASAAAGTRALAPAASTPTAPSAPRHPAIAPGHGQVVVTWTAPTSTGGSPLTAYRVRVTPGNRTVTVTAPATSATVTGLADGTQVTATVGALNAVGASPASSAGSAIPTPPISDGPALPQEEKWRGDLASGPDGTVYVATADAISELSPDSTALLPLDVGTVRPRSLAVGPGGDLFWIDDAPGYLVIRRLHDGVVDTVAGTDSDEPDPWPTTTPQPATEAVLASATDLAVSPVDGTVFVVDYLRNTILGFAVGGDLAVVAGAPDFNDPAPISGDGGPATAAVLGRPHSVAVGDDGAVYVSDALHHRVRRFTVGGTIDTVAGDGTTTIDPGADLDADGTGLPSPDQLSWLPGRGLLIDSQGRERLLVGDRLRRVGDDAFDRAWLESEAPPGEGPLSSFDATLSLMWSGDTLWALHLLPVGSDHSEAVLKQAGPWLPSAAPAEHPGFGSWTDLVVLHHRAILGRPPTAAEQTTWTDALEGGSATPGELDDALRRSLDNTANVDPIVRLYRAFLDRAPDASGVRFWINRKRAVPPARTWKVADLAAQFTASSEFQRKYGAFTDRQFVTHIYVDVLDRDGDQAGIDFWTRRLETRRQTRAQVMLGFSESSEYRREQAATTDVAVAYLDLIGRMPTPTETDAWVTAAAGGTTHVDLLDQLVVAAPGLV